MDTTWNGEVRVLKPIEIAENVTLRVAPGSRVTFASRAGITVNGTMEALAEGERPIRLGSSLAQPYPSSWVGITVNGRLVFSNVSIAHATEAIVLQRDAEGMLSTAIFSDNTIPMHVYQARLSATGCNFGERSVRFTNPLNVSIHASTLTIDVKDPASHILIQRSILSKANFKGYGNNNISILESTLPSGAVFFGRTQHGDGKIADVTLERNVVSNNDGPGISIGYGGEGAERVTIKMNTITNSEHGLWIATQGSVDVIENSIHSNRKAGLMMGVAGYPATVTARSNLISKNAGFGIYAGATGLSLIKNDIVGNSAGGMEGVLVEVPAELNYWGHPSGPHHLSINPEGQGDSIRVIESDFIPWATERQTPLSVPVGVTSPSPTQAPSPQPFPTTPYVSLPTVPPSAVLAEAEPPAEAPYPSFFVVLALLAVLAAIRKRGG